jgi:hypothetical protein
LVGLGLAVNAQAAVEVKFSPDVLEVLVGETVGLDIVADFSSDPTIGGGVDILFDPTRLAFAGFAFLGTGLVLDPSFSRAPTAGGAGELLGLGFGNFAGVGGPGTVGTVSFEALAPGSSTVSLRVNDGRVGMPGAFFSAASFSEQTALFGSAQVTAVSSVPLPGALGLLASALLGVPAVARRRSRTVPSASRAGELRARSGP